MFKSDFDIDRSLGLQYIPSFSFLVNNFVVLGYVFVRACVCACVCVHVCICVRARVCVWFCMHA